MLLFLSNMTKQDSHNKNTNPKVGMLQWNAIDLIMVILMASHLLMSVRIHLYPLEQ